MGSGASREGEIVEEDEYYTHRSDPAITGTADQEAPGSPRKRGSLKKDSSVIRQQSRSSEHTKGSLKHPSHTQQSSSRFIEGYENAIVSVSQVGFSVQEVTVMEGMSVTFVWEDRNNYTLMQVVYDGEKLRPVIGGYRATAEEYQRQFEQIFNLEGEYKFALSGIRCTPLTVNVRRRTDLQAEITDEGFQPEIIYIDQGHAIKWTWKQCAVPHTVQEAVLCMDRGCFRKLPSNTSVVATVTGSYRHQFNKPGMYYFQTESAELGHIHWCVVHVKEAPREYKVEVMDRAFQPMILLIEEGDRVWFHWDRYKCKKLHSVYQIEAPGNEHGDTEPYVPVKDGFRWSTPSKQGLMSHEFYKTGVYYYSDQNFEEAAEYMGTIIVKPKQKEHIINITDRGFTPDLCNVQTGDRISWIWDGKAVADVGEHLLVMEEEKCLNPIAKKQSQESEDHFQMIDDEAARLLTRAGVATYSFTTIGVYHFRIADTGNTYSLCSVIVNPGPKNHTVHLTDNGFEPKVITVRPNDRVWWVWQSCKKQHNILQVSNLGKPIEGGFSSGQKRDSPSAFVHQFVMPGVFYFISSNLPKVFGAIVVSTQPQVHEVNVEPTEIKPDPVTIQLNDIVCWIFREPCKSGVVRVETVRDLNGEQNAEEISPRRCIGRVFTQMGVTHFYHRKFGGKKKNAMRKKKRRRKLYMEDVPLSSVICDPRHDNSVIRVDKQGFHPKEIYLQKGQSVLWTWKGSSEEHNIIHVNSPDSREPLDVIQGPRSFNSGKPLPNNSFLYTFDEEGSFTVASQGAPGYSCTVHILNVAPRTKEPVLSTEPNGGRVDKETVVNLVCDTPNSDIYYTIDGTAPMLYSANTKKYYADRGVVLKSSGLSFVRAVAVTSGHLHSHPFTSRRFRVTPREGEEESEGGEEVTASSAESEAEKTPRPVSAKTWEWRDCVPKIKGCFSGSGIMEIFWELPPPQAVDRIKGYQLYLNGVSYCEMFPSKQNSLNVTGLAGGRLYEVLVEVFPRERGLQPQESNKLLLRSPLMSSDGGPVISLETSDRKDTLTIVWMSVDTVQRPVEGYRVFLNDQQCGSELVPDPDSNRCKVVIGGCDLGKTYKIYVLGILTGTPDPVMSNVIEVQLPLDTSHIQLPPPNERLSDEDLYVEYAEVHQGSGYLPQMDDPASQTVEETEESEEEDSDQDKLVNQYNRQLDTSIMEEEPVTGRSAPRVIEVETKDQGVNTDDIEHGKLQQTPTTPRVKGYDDSSSEYDSESDSSESEDERERPSGGRIILDVKNNEAMDQDARAPRKRKAKEGEEIRRFSPTKGEFQEGQGYGAQTETVVGPSAITDTPRKRRKRTAAAIVEVQRTVELDKDRDIVREDGHIERHCKLAVPVQDRESMVIVGEGELIMGDGDGILPAPSIMVESRGRSAAKVFWELPRQPDPEYRLVLYVVNVVGARFSSEVNSDISFECNLVEKGKPIRGVQHCWNITNQQKCTIRGLMPSLTYRIYVIANFALMKGNKPCEVQTTSSVLYYTTIGPPKSPKMRVVNVDLYQASVEWDEPRVHKDLKLKGYQIYLDNKPLGGIRPSDVRQMMINNMVPGKTISLYVVAVTSRAAQESEPSKTIHITCPRQPPAPFISQQPSYKQGCVLVAWDKPAGHTPASNDEEISMYSVYVNGHWHGEVKANKIGDKQGYQFFLTDLSPDQSYDVAVKTIAGHRRVDPDASHHYSLSDSHMSNVLPVRAPAAPRSPKLRLEGMTPEGIDVTWQTPQQFGEACISGYQMLKNGKLYGSIIPPDVNCLRIRDVSLGEKVTLQLIALTEHPVGKNLIRVGDGTSSYFEKDSGKGSSHPDGEEKIPATRVHSPHKLIVFTDDVQTSEWPTKDSKLDVFSGERYAGCKPGPKLVVHYTGLVQAPLKVWCEKVTGHSALIVWNADFEPKSHFVRPHNFQVTWWPGDKPQDDINSDSTTDDHFLITNLRANRSYTVVVEARKMEKYTDIDENSYTLETPDGLNAFILTAKSEHLQVKTARPPEPPRNLGLVANTCTALLVAWDPPQEFGVEVLGIRIECVSLNTADPHFVIVDVMPDARQARVEQLHEKTDYLLRLVAITEEYFDRLPDKHRFKKQRSIPKDTLISHDDSPWLPSSTILVKTAGTEAPAGLKVIKSTMTSMTLQWTPPLVYGSNKLLGQIVRWSDVRRAKGRREEEEVVLASHVNLLGTENALTIEDLTPGALYRVVVEAVVSVKTALEKDHLDSAMEKNRRTAHILSKALMARTRAPVEAPRLLLVSYTQTSANLYWEKPMLMSVVGKDDLGNPKYLRRYLEGYKLEINGKLHCFLGPSAQSCTLTKVKPGKIYHIVLVAMTCTEDVKKERKIRFKGFLKTYNSQEVNYNEILSDDENLDESPSEPLEVVLPRNQEGFLASVEAAFDHQQERDSQTFGDVQVKWSTQGEKERSHLKQFNLVWFSLDDRVIQTKYISPEQRSCTLPITRLKSIYSIKVDPVYYTDIIPQTPQEIQIMIPGPPDAPEIFLRHQDEEEFIIEWGEPRLYGGVKVRGYQVYLNDKKAGNVLSSSHRKAVIPCRRSRMYRVNLVALSANPEYGDSAKSNMLTVNSSAHTPRQEGGMLDDWSSTDDHELPVKVTLVTETSIHLDWSRYLEAEDVSSYRVEWSSVAQPAQREVRLSNKDNNCVINKCLPGTTHFVRVLALDVEGAIVDKSKQLTIQTSAPPDAPVLSIRACNFRYIAVQWEKPTTYGDALITGYKVYVNGIVEAILNADQNSFTFTHGKWCHEYTFQVQALTASERLNSKPSEPLVVPWPGVRSPPIRRLPAVSSSCLRVSWDTPYMTDGVRVRHYQLVCLEEGTEKVIQSVGPIHPDSREAEFKNLKKGNYAVFLEIHLYGTSEVVRSDPMKMQPAVCPAAPQISVVIVGLEERNQLEKVTCELVNKRDRLIRAVGHKLKKIGALSHPIKAERDDDVVMAAHTLTRVEELLEDCFSALEEHTGQLICHLSWQCPQSDPSVVVSGFKILVDGKQYGNTMHAGVRTVRIKLSLDQVSYRLSMVSLSEKPQGSSEESNVVELLTLPFRPFTFYCYHSLHSKDAKWPSYGCCKYQDSIVYERQVAKKLANQGLLSKHVPPPACSLMGVFDGQYRPLLATHKPQYPTVIAFWTPWCLASQRLMNHLVQFARETVKEFNFVAVTCDSQSAMAQDRKSLIQTITANGWREDGVIWHCTSECASNIVEATNNIRRTAAGLKFESEVERTKHVDLTDLLGIAGVPTLLFIHPDGYIAWHGRYSALDYAAFQAFMRHTLAEVIKHPCPVFNCDCCKNDMSVVEEAIGTIIPENKRNVTVRISDDADMKYAAVDGYTENVAGTERIFLRRRRSPKRKSQLSVNKRPFSAHSTQYQVISSPYLTPVVQNSPLGRQKTRPSSAKRLLYFV